MKKFLVIGNPIEHSLSPQVHNYWIKKYGLVNGVYEKEKVEENEDEEEEESEGDEDSPYVIFEYDGKEYGFDSSIKIENYYEIDEENNKLGKAVNTLKLIKPKSLNKKEVFILHDKKKKYIIECLEDYIPGNIIGYKKGADYILNK